MAQSWPDIFRNVLAAKGYTLKEFRPGKDGRWFVRYSYDGSLSGDGSFEARDQPEVLRMVDHLPLVAHPEAREVLWASRIPLAAAARVGKVHLVNPGAYETLCGLRVPRPSKRFTPGESDARCIRCARRAGR